MGTWVHRLIEKDVAAERGICVFCGPVRIISVSNGKGKPRTWKCAVSRGRHKNDQAYRNHLSGDTCERCGFKAHHLCQLDIHHRDGDHSNNSPANLATICTNCHRLEHVKIGP